MVELVLEVLEVHLGVVVVVARLGVKYLVTAEAVLVTVFRTVDWLFASARWGKRRGFVSSRREREHARQMASLTLR